MQLKARPMSNQIHHHHCSYDHDHNRHSHHHHHNRRSHRYHLWSDHHYLDLENTGAKPISKESKPNAGDTKTKSENLIFNFWYVLQNLYQEPYAIIHTVLVFLSFMFLSCTFSTSELLESWIDMHGLKIKLSLMGLSGLPDYDIIVIHIPSECEKSKVLGAW